MPNCEPTYAGGCACGAVRFTAHGRPLRVALCHCLTCRKAHASAFNPFVVYPADRVKISGELHGWQSSPRYERRFCPACGSRVVGVDADGREVELSLGSFDEVGVLTPEHENWICRREPWLVPLNVPQYERDRLADNG